MPSISAVLIVKNEAPRLAACLQALQEVADEIVVADTGSTDDTLEIARRYTPHCHAISWADDFAAARNQAIARATGRWVLSIDADEVVDDPARARMQLLEFMQSRADGGTGTLQHRSPTGTGPDPTIQYGDVERFFPRGRYVFTGAIHEQLVPVAGPHPGTSPTGVIVRHSGYNRAGSDPNHKARRNLPLLQKVRAAEPENEYIHYQLGRAHFALEQFPEAIAAFEQALRLMNFGDGAPCTRQGLPIGREVLTTLITSLAYAYANADRLQDAERLLAEHQALGHAGTQWADFHHACGYVALMRGDMQRAKAGYEESMRCGQAHEDIAGTGSHASAYHLGLLAEVEQDVVGAIAHYGTALRLKPDYRVALDRYCDFMVEHELGVAPDIQRHADPEAFRAACLRKVDAFLAAGERAKAELMVAAVGRLSGTNKRFAGDLLERCLELGRPHGMV